MPIHSDLTGAELHVPWRTDATDPGAIGAGKVWRDPSRRAWVRNATDTGWEPLVPTGAPAVEIIAHRGGGDSGTSYARAPEDTIPGITSAIGSAHAVKIDVQVTADGYPILMHDSTVNRTTNGTGDPLTMTLSAIQALDAGSKFDARFAGTKVPRLEEALSAARPFRRINIDLKRLHNATREAEIAMIVGIIRDAGMEDRVRLSSLNGATDLPIVRQYSRAIEIIYTCTTLLDWQANLPLAAADGNASIAGEYTYLLADPSLVADARARGVTVQAFTPNSAYLCAQLIAMGVTRINTDNLDAVRALVPLGL